YDRAPSGFSLLHVDCSYFGCGQLGLASSQVRLVTWPDMTAVDASTGVGRFVSNFDRPSPPPDEHYTQAAYWLEPAMSLEARWYAIRWTPPPLPGGEEWSPVGVPIAGGDYVFRFYGVSRPELRLVLVGPREGGGVSVTVEFSEDLQSVPAATAASLVQIAQEGRTCTSLYEERNPVFWFTCVPEASTQLPMRLQVSSGLVSRGGAPVPPVDVTFDFEAGGWYRHPSALVVPRVPAALFAGVECE
ncbi:MAG: hypothetical protein K8H88_33725, partial [Sandaracinaceae bacterium]|nr:hypothetical protein [Sandaracinaceae bacterium]